MKKQKLLLIIAILIVLIICICILLFKSNEEIPENPVTMTEIQIKEVTDRDTYYMVENCVNKFYKYYASIYENKNHEEEDIKKTYNLLDKKYITFNNITKENLPTILPAINESVVNIYDMYGSSQENKIDIYIVSGVLREELTKELTDFKVMIKIDMQNGTFSVLLQDYIEAKFPDLKLGENINVELLENIQKNQNNLYILEEISEETYVLDLFDRYVEECLYNPKYAYEHLDEEYRTVKFQTIGSFQQFVKEVMKEYKNVKVEQYSKEEKEDYTQYVFFDNNGFYYVFRETGLMSFTAILDGYTIDLPEFLEVYYASNTVERVAYNIQKCLDAINSKDYKYVYNKLDFEFKALNYPTLERFEETIKTKLFNRNEVIKVKSANEGATYAYKLTIADVENKEKHQDMTVIMQLKEGTDFVMSLSFQ